MYFVIATTTIKIIKSVNVTWGIKNKNTPSDVATPFPPLKFKKKDKVCPIIAIIPIRSNEFPATPNLLAIKGGKKPFKASAISTIIPNFGPNTL